MLEAPEVCDLCAVERIANCLRVLGSHTLDDSEIERIWLELCHQSFKAMIQDKLDREAKNAKLMVHGPSTTRPMCPAYGISNCLHMQFPVPLA